MAKNEFTNDWLIGYIARRKSEKDPMSPIPDDIPDPGLEKTLQKKVMDHCKENGWPCFHDRSKRVNEPGWPDCFIFLPGGKVVLIELKSSSGKFRKEQNHFRVICQHLGHHIYQARSFKRVVEIINRERR